MTGEHHLLLLIKYRNGEPLREPVHAVAVGPGVFRLLYTPGLVLGIAAEDEFRLLGGDGAFEVIRRGRNLAVQLLSDRPVEPLKAELVERASHLGGWLDGGIECGLVFTVPVTAGFRAVEAVFDGWVAEHPDWEWAYGDVYDPTDGVTPLGWWTK